MDLHVDNTIRRDNHAHAGEVINLFDQASLDKSLMPATELTGDSIIEAHERVLLSTVEVVKVPHGYVGLIMLRSTVARAGLIAPTTYADSGFVGTLTMEVFNSNKWGIDLQAGTHIWNMVLVPAPFELDYNGRYQNQPHGVVGPKALDYAKDMWYYKDNIWAPALQSPDG